MLEMETMVVSETLLKTFLELKKTIYQYRMQQNGS